MLSKTKLKIVSFLSMVFGFLLSQPMNSAAQPKPLQNKTALKELGAVKPSVAITMSYLQRHTSSGVSMVPVDRAFPNPAERQEFLQWISAQGLQEVMYEDALEFRLDSLQKRIEVLESK